MLFTDERIIHENHENYAVVTQAVHDLREDVNEVFKAQSKQLNGKSIQHLPIILKLIDCYIIM